MRNPAVLCVDDVEEILGFYQNLLGKYGYEVMVATDGSEALDLFQSSGEPIDAVILDFQMPAMSGLELAILLKGIDPDLPIVMVSGNSPQLEEMAPFVDAVFPKGASIRELSEQLDLLLEAHGARSPLVS